MYFVCMRGSQVSLRSERAFEEIARHGLEGLVSYEKRCT